MRGVKINALQSRQSAVRSLRMAFQCSPLCARGQCLLSHSPACSLKNQSLHLSLFQRLFLIFTLLSLLDQSALSASMLWLANSHLALHHIGAPDKHSVRKTSFAFSFLQTFPSLKHWMRRNLTSGRIHLFHLEQSFVQLSWRRSVLFLGRRKEEKSFFLLHSWSSFWFLRRFSKSLTDLVRTFKAAKYFVFFVSCREGRLSVCGRYTRAFLYLKYRTSQTYTNVRVGKWVGNGLRALTVTWNMDTFERNTNRMNMREKSDEKASFISI